MASIHRLGDSAMLRAQAMRILDLDGAEMQKLPPSEKKSAVMSRTLASAYLCGYASMQEIETEKLVAQCDLEFATIYDKPGTASPKGSQLCSGRSALSSGASMDQNKLASS